MFKEATVRQLKREEFQRELGRYGGIVPGPLVICIGGIHGNEPAGARALQNVLADLQAARPAFNGEFVALAGNLGALNQETRYLLRDLNRMWLPDQVERLKSESLSGSEEAEYLEQRELLAAIESVIAGRTGNLIFLDLHTTSSDGAPFALISDTLVNRHLAMRLGVPIILGLEENIEGTILNYINELGFAAIGFEAGQHQAPSSVKHHEAVIWLALVEAGCLAPQRAPEPAALRSGLKKAVNRIPRVMEVRYRHAIQESDQFVMRPGFTNFHPVEKSQPLASDHLGEVRSPEDGLLFMPLYQKLGEDGFFLVRQVNTFWLKVSEYMRRLKFDRVVPFLPGVDYLPGRRDALVIDTRIARWFVIEICHLLGFRKHSQVEGRLVVSRRRQSPED